MTIDQLTHQAYLIRHHVWQMIYQAKSGHPAGSLDVVDILTSLYFAPILRYQADQPQWPERDYFLLSNGHTCPALYATLAEAGYFNIDKLSTLRQLNSGLQGHPHYGSLPGIENTSGALGQGLSQAIGLALGLKLNQQSNHVYVLASDGEHQEGQIWEAYMFAAKKELNNLTVIVDRNFIQIDGRTETVMPLASLEAKITAFNWQVLKVDGHNFPNLINQLKQTKTQSKPTAIIAKTIPGKGIGFIENDYHWHGRVPNRVEYLKGLQELMIYDN